MEVQAAGDPILFYFFNIYFLVTSYQASQKD